MLRSVDMTLDAVDAERLATFWRLAAGYVDEPPPSPHTSRREWLAALGEPVAADEPVGAAWLVHPGGLAPRLSILQVPEPKTAKNRLHLDLRVSGDGNPAERWGQVLAEVERLRRAGAAVAATFEGHHVVMTDPEGNEFCVA